MEGPPVWEVLGGRGRQTAPTCRTPAREGNQRQAGLTVSWARAPFRRRGLWVLGAGDPKGWLCGPRAERCSG